MARLRKAAKALAHVAAFSAIVHLATCDRILDAAADVGLDKATDFAIHAMWSAK
jgi:hypothetical protein